MSYSARLLVSASTDSHVRVWDIPSGNCIDWFKMHKPVKSLTFSPRTDFLATSHVGSNGIYIWYVYLPFKHPYLLDNWWIRMFQFRLFSKILFVFLFFCLGLITVRANAMYFSSVFFKRIPTEPKLIATPNIDGLADDEDEDEAMDQDFNPHGTIPGPYISCHRTSLLLRKLLWEKLNEFLRFAFFLTGLGLWEDVQEKDQLAAELITFSRLPSSKWHTLLNLDIIIERNKLEKPEPELKPAPFLLSTTLTLSDVCCR